MTLLLFKVVLVVVGAIATILMLFKFAGWAENRSMLAKMAKIVVGANYTATYTIGGSHPWDPSETKMWNVKVFDVKDGYVAYYHYRDDGLLITHDFSTATVHDFLSLYVLIPPDECQVPPAGWRCTREPGHEGPCAALPR